MNQNFDPWAIREEDFPGNGSPIEKLKFCLRYAALGHSTYNTQPWYFYLEHNTVSIYADRRYALPVLDPDDRQLLMSCATAAFNLRLALRYFGHRGRAQFLPNPADENLIARIQITDEVYTATEEEKALFKAITTRHINRSAFKTKDVEQEKIEALKKAAEKEGAWLHICQDDERDVVAHFIAEADHEQMSRKSFRRELAMWVDERRFLNGDGFPGYYRSVKELMDRPRPRIIRRFEISPSQVVQDDEIASGCPVLAILGSEKGGLADRLYAGQAFMRVLLQAEALGLSVSTLNQPCEVPDLRLRLHDEIEHTHGRAQYILRIGYGDPVVNYSLRRPIEALIETNEDFIAYRNEAKNDNASAAKKKSIFARFFKFLGAA